MTKLSYVTGTTAPTDAEGVNLPVVGNTDTTEQPKIPEDIQSIVDWLNGTVSGEGIGGGNLLPAFLATLFTSVTSAGNGKVWGVSFGVVDVTGPYGSGANAQYSNIVTVNHNLGVIPTAIYATAYSGSQVVNVVGNPDSSSFELQGIVIPNGFDTAQYSQWGSGNQSTVPTAWLAIGAINAPTS